MKNEKVSEAEAYDIGIEAYTYLYPLVLMDTTRRQTVNARAGKFFSRGPMNTFIHSRSFPPPDFRDHARMNYGILYSAAWLDLTREPMVVTVPDTLGRYYALPMVDMWTDVFAAPGKRTTGTGPGRFAVVPPDWQGKLPETVLRINAPTPYFWILGRTQTNGPEDYEAVRKVQNGYTITPLSQLDKALQPAPEAIDPTVDMNTPPKAQVSAMTAGKFFAYAADLMKVNPPHSSDQLIIAQLQRIGIEPGKSFDLDKADPVVKRALEQVPTHALNALSAKLPTFARIVHGWQMNTDTMGAYGNSYDKRALVALTGLGANLPDDAVYLQNVCDAEGKPLNGANKYLLHFTKDQIPPVNAFWSITLYDKDGFPTINALDRLALSDHDNLNYNADGSLDLYIQHESPGMENESNWLPAPTGIFTLMMRLYAPRIDVLDGLWAPPPIKQVQ